MRTFSKLVFICNCCFIIAAVMRLLELHLGKSNYQDAVVKLPALVASIILLGVFLSILLNIIFSLIMAVKKLNKKQVNIPLFFYYFNLIMLPIQLWYYFYFKG